MIAIASDPDTRDVYETAATDCCHVALDLTEPESGDIADMRGHGQGEPTAAGSTGSDEENDDPISFVLSRTGPNVRVPLGLFRAGVLTQPILIDFFSAPAWK